MQICFFLYLNAEHNVLSVLPRLALGTKFPFFLMAEGYSEVFEVYLDVLVFVL